MAEKTFKLEIVTPERVVFSEEVASLVVPGVEGSLGILANHAPLVAELAVGKITIRDADGHESCMATSGGFMEVQNNVVRILADSAELVCDIDLVRAEEARKRAEERLHAHTANLDHARAEIALKRAINRIRIARD